LRRHTNSAIRLDFKPRATPGAPRQARRWRTPGTSIALPLTAITLLSVIWISASIRVDTAPADAATSEARAPSTRLSAAISRANSTNDSGARLMTAALTTTGSDASATGPQRITRPLALPRAMPPAAPAATPDQPARAAPPQAGHADTPDALAPATHESTVDTTHDDETGDRTTTLRGDDDNPLESVAAAPAQATTSEGPSGEAQSNAEPTERSIALEVKSGDSLDRLFRRHGLSITDLHAMLAVEEAARALRIVRPGDEIQVRRAGTQVMAMTRALDEFHTLELTRDSASGRYEATVVEHMPERRVVHASGRITSSLFNAGRAAGVSDKLVMELAGVFAWDIDFVLDIRQNDEFTVLYEELWRDGRKLGDGNILAAEFVNAGRSYRALRYVDPDGNADYYTPDGLNMRKAFLRAPVDFHRISSNFNLKRRHPVLNTIRAHRGVDYAAPPGTPIKAAGNGKVSFRGVKGGYGNVVILQHGDNISTLYAHMSRFGRFREGSRVRQGDIIGFVGSSGMVTGPHLHYEYRVAGVHRNPRTVKLPQAQPVPADFRADFQTHAEYALAQLELVKSVRLAAAGD
jgi:murein DD-endopeptidase MepM/ murein hydrolase activator NlpD